MIGKRSQDLINRIVVLILLFIGMIVVLTPLVWMMVSALKSPDAVNTNPPQWIPTEDGRQVFDPVDGMWAAPPQFPMGSSGLVSTIDDLVAFTDALRDGRLISAESLTAMTTDHLTAPQRDAAAAYLDGAGWGFGWVRGVWC